MIMPRVFHKPDRTPFLGRLYAHRGLHDNNTDAPENSMKAFKKAVEAGYGIELDVQLTKDKIPVVFHDFTLKRVCGAEGRVDAYTYEELQQFHLMNSDEKIPLFSDFLKLVDGKVPLIVEMKIERDDVTVCELANELLKDYKGVYCIESFSPFGVLWYKKHRPETMRGQLSEEFAREKEGHGIVFWIMAKLLENFITRPDFVAYNTKHYKNLSRRICRSFYGNLAVAWTIKSQEDLEFKRKYFDSFIFDSFVPKGNC